MCWVCDDGGDVLDLVAGHLFDSTSKGITSDQWRAIQTECAKNGWCMNASRQDSITTPSQARRPMTSEPSERPVSSSGFQWLPDLPSSCVDRLWTDSGKLVRDYLEYRKITVEAAKHFGLGAYESAPGETWLTIPLRDETGTPVNLRFRRLPDEHGTQPGGPKYRVCAGRPLPLFGSDELSLDAGDEPIIVEGELDRISLWQYGYQQNVVSTTAGAKTFAEEWLDLLEPFSGFLICYDNDDAGKDGATALAKKLGRHRCLEVKLPKNDVNACLMADVVQRDIDSAIGRAKPMVGMEIVSAGVYREEIERLVRSPDELIGRPTGSDNLDLAIGGIRPGLIILTAETGEGKSTFATWLVAQQARMGVGGLLTSFEQSPVGTVQKLLRQQIGGDFTQCTEAERAEAMDELDRLPLHIVKHRGMLSPQKVLDTMRFAVRRKDVRNILIDHLGFVIDPDAEDERRAIQKVVRELSIIAEYEAVSCFLVCHPSNQHLAQRRRVGLGDLKGASAIRQDAHEVWVLEKVGIVKSRPYPAARIHFDKVRSDFGASGSEVTLAFDPLACVYADKWSMTPSGMRGVDIGAAMKKGKPGTLPRRDK